MTCCFCWVVLIFAVCEFNAHGGDRATGGRHIPYAFEKVTNYTYDISNAIYRPGSNYSMNVGFRSSAETVSWGAASPAGKDVIRVYKCSAYVDCTNAAEVECSREALSLKERARRPKECTYKLSIQMKDWECVEPAQKLSDSNGVVSAGDLPAFCFTADIDQNGRIIGTDIGQAIKEFGHEIGVQRSARYRELVMSSIVIFWQCALPRLPSASDARGDFRGQRDWMAVGDDYLQEQLSLSDPWQKWQTLQDKRGRVGFWQRRIECRLSQESDRSVMGDDMSREFFYDPAVGAVADGSLDSVVLESEAVRGTTKAVMLGRWSAILRKPWRDGKEEGGGGVKSEGVGGSVEEPVQ